MNGGLTLLIAISYHRVIGFRAIIDFIQETGTFQSALLFTNTISDPMIVT